MSDLNQTNQKEGLPPRMPLYATFTNRDETVDKDARLVNGYVEKNALGELDVCKRPGMSLHTTLSGAGRGVFNWRGDIYAVFGSTLYKNGSSLGTVDATGGVYTFDSILGSTPKLTLLNGVYGYYSDGSSLTQVTDVDFPSTTTLRKGSGYLNGVSYVLDVTANLRGSDPNDFSSWDPLNVLVAQIEPDRGVRVAKQLVYIIVFKEWTTEVFHDAGNSTGSPLSSVEGALMEFGCFKADSVQDMDDTLFFLSATQKGSIGVHMISKLKVSKISTSALDRLLEAADYSSGVYSWSAKVAGHAFYVLTVPASNFTFAYDVEVTEWFQWTDTNGNYLPIVAATADSAQNVIVQHESNGCLYYLSGNTFTDDGALFSWELYTPNTDLQTRQRKNLPRMIFTADRADGSLLEVRHSDDDYTTWTPFREVDLGHRYPMLSKCGTFSRRAWHMRHRCNTRLRIKAVDLPVDLGVI